MTDFEIEQAKRTLIDQKLEFQENYVDFGGVARAYDYAIECIEYRQDLENRIRALQEHQNSKLQIDQIESDDAQLTNTANPPKYLLIDIRRHIDNYRERLSKLQNKLIMAVEKYDDEHKIHDTK